MQTQAADQEICSDLEFGQIYTYDIDVYSLTSTALVCAGTT